MPINQFKGLLFRNFIDLHDIFAFLFSRKKIKPLNNYELDRNNFDSRPRKNFFEFLSEIFNGCVFYIRPIMFQHLKF